MPAIQEHATSWNEGAVPKLQETAKELSIAILAGDMRRLLHEPPKGTEVATHTEALAILTRLARDGRTTAAIALEKTLRGEQQPASELEAFLRG